MKKKMKCLFVMPPWTFKDTHIKELQSDVAGVSAPTGILYLASMVKEKGHEAFVIDGAFYSHDEIIERFKKINPDIVGISIVTMLWENSKLLMKDLKKNNPNVFIIIGGPHPNVMMEKLFSESKDFDALAFGDGEYTIQELVEVLSKKNKSWKKNSGKTNNKKINNRKINNLDLSGIKGIVYRKGKSFKKNKPREMIKNIDELPYPAFDLIDLHKYRPSIGHYQKLPSGEIVTGRGCPFNCLYCSKIHGSKTQDRDPIKVVDELEYYIKKFGIKEVKVWNELFTINKKFVMTFCDEVLRRKLDIMWSATARVDTVDMEMLRKMKKAGCWCLHFGIESGLQKNLITLRKGTKVTTIKKAVRMTQKAGIKCFASYILGIPGETYEDALKTIEFACKLNTYYAEFFPLTPFPGTDLYKDLNRYGKLLVDITKLTMHHVCFTPHSMTKKELEKVRNYAFKRYYTRPRFILMRLLSIRTWQDIKIGWHGFRALLKIIS